MSFRDLSLEIRISIFEYATSESTKIAPRQVAKGSNKFAFFVVQPETQANGRVRDERRARQLTATSLMYTCRQFYHDLKAYPVFYRFNTFVFQEPHTLHAFLAALTPDRRRSIRNIEVSDRPAWTGGWVPSELGYNLKGGHYDHISTLLRDCRDLRHITFNLLLSRHCMTDPGMQYLLASLRSKCRSAVRPDAHSLWNLPGFDLNVVVVKHTRFPGHVLSRFDSTMTFSDFVSAEKELPYGFRFSTYKTQLKSIASTLR